MRFKFLSTFVGVVIIAAIVGMSWAFFASSRVVVDEKVFISVIAAEHNAMILMERNLRSY